MGKVKIITHEQELLLDKFRKDKFLSSKFYFTGGTALSLHYLQHRRSIDLDFFSTDQFEAEAILNIVTNWSKEIGFTVDYLVIENTQIFNLNFPNKQMTKIDFALFPHNRIKESRIIDGIQVDSYTDIAINKLIAVEQRAEVKDFVDLYFLLRDFSIWDLLEGVKVKFRVKIDPFIIGSDFLKVESFDFLPEMIKPLTLKDLKQFFREKAKAITSKSVE